MAPTWAYGVTCVPARFDRLLPRTLESLAAAGWDRPRLFVDGTGADPGWQPGRVGCRDGWTVRDPALGAFGNWVLALWELWVRAPRADLFALFQDDLVCVRNLRAYVEREAVKPSGMRFFNLYTAAPGRQDPPPRSLPGGAGWYHGNDMVRGALALVLPAAAVRAVLADPGVVARPLDAQKGTRNIDGAVSEALRPRGWREWVHAPSPVQHTGGDCSTLAPAKHHKPAADFPGEAWDALAWLPTG